GEDDAGLRRAVAKGRARTTPLGHDRRAARDASRPEEAPRPGSRYALSGCRRSLLWGGSNAAGREGPPSASAVAVGQRRDASRLDPPYAAPKPFARSHAPRGHAVFDAPRRLLEPSREKWDADLPNEVGDFQSDPARRIIGKIEDD